MKGKITYLIVFFMCQACLYLSYCGKGDERGDLLKDNGSSSSKETTIVEKTVEGVTSGNLDEVDVAIQGLKDGYVEQNKLDSSTKPIRRTTKKPESFPKNRAQKSLVELKDFLSENYDRITKTRLSEKEIEKMVQIEDEIIRIDQTIKTNFNDIETKIQEGKLPEIARERLLNTQRNYNEKINFVLDRLKKIDSLGKETENLKAVKGYVDELKGFLDKNIKKQKSVPLGSELPPFRMLSPETDGPTWTI